VDWQLSRRGGGYRPPRSVLYTVKEKGGKPDGKPHPLPYGLINPYRKLKSENSQDYAQKPQRNCTLMNSDSGATSLG
jgi:hypothetical protein